MNGFKTVLDYDDDYNLSKITTPSGKTFGVKQDKFGHIKELSLPDGGKVSYKYDEQGNLISVTDPNGTTKEYKYDDDSRMTSWKDENGNTVVKNTYDKEGRVVEQTDAERQLSSTERVLLQQRITKEIRPFIIMMISTAQHPLNIRMEQPVKRLIMQRISLLPKRQQPEQKLTLMIHLAM